MDIKKKKIKILTNGAITVKGFINGPVLTPYYEDISTIFKMVSSGIKVVEVCDDNVEIVLSTSNFTDDHSKAAREAKATKPIVKEEPVVTETIVDAEPVEPEQTGDVEGEMETVETVVEVDDEKVSDKPHHKENFNKNNKNNKHNNSHKSNHNRNN